MHSQLQNSITPSSLRLFYLFFLSCFPLLLQNRNAACLNRYRWIRLSYLVSFSVVLKVVDFLLPSTCCCFASRRPFSLILPSPSRSCLSSLFTVQFSGACRSFFGCLRRYLAYLFWQATHFSSLSFFRLLCLPNSCLLLPFSILHFYSLSVFVSLRFFFSLSLYDSPFYQQLRSSLTLLSLSPSISHLFLSFFLGSLALYVSSLSRSRQSLNHSVLSSSQGTHEFVLDRPEDQVIERLCATSHYALPILSPPRARSIVLLDLIVTTLFNSSDASPVS